MDIQINNTVTEDGLFLELYNNILFLELSFQSSIQLI